MKQAKITSSIHGHRFEEAAAGAAQRRELPVGQQRAEQIFVSELVLVDVNVLFK